jgi:oligoendopeptidase F
MHKFLSTALLSLLPLLPTLCIAETEQDRWDLNALYATPAKWSEDTQKLENELKSFAQCNGNLAKSAKQFLQCWDLNNEIQKRYARIESYASQTHDQDTGGNSGIELKQRSDVLANKLESGTAFVRPEVLAMGQAKVRQFMAQEKKLAIYRHTLDEILRAAPHTLDAKSEALIADFGLITTGPNSIYSTLTDADFPWPSVKLSDGSTVTLDQAAYGKYRSVENRADRKLVFDAFWGKFKDFERTLGATLYEQLKRDWVYAKVRHYPSSLASALDDNKLPVGVYDMLIQQANTNLPTLHRYFKLRAKMLKINDLQYFDVYPPLVKGGRPYPLAEAKQIMLDSVKPLGVPYVDVMQAGLQNRWMDVYPRSRKRSGAYNNGSAYDVHPYLLLNYNDDYESVSTMAHEWGHAMHSDLANKAQPFVNANYPTFTAEIASTTNELLLLDHVLKIAKSDDERLLYLGSALENLRGTFFRQAMFAEFERETHARVDKGEALSGESFTKIYADIIKRYHGDQQGVLKVDDRYTVEWAFISHFYMRFYVFQYATSITAGTTFGDRILKGTPGAREAYLDILKAGGSEYPYDMVKKAGVDLATPVPYQALVARMNKIMDEIEGILAKR